MHVALKKDSFERASQAENLAMMVAIRHQPTPAGVWADLQSMQQSSSDRVVATVAAAHPDVFENCHEWHPQQ